MPSWNGLWISGLTVGTLLGVALVLYSWEHASGFVTSCFRRQKKAPKVPPGEDADDDGPQLKSRKDKAAFKVPDKAVAVDIQELSLYPVVLAWEDLELKVYTGDATAVKTVVHKCSGTFMPSEFVAIMGPSGAGKSSMLDILAGRKTGKGVDGSVTLNGLPIEPNLAHRCISYVGQEDVFLPMLTVWESLLFIARLSMQPLPNVVRTARMNAVLETLGLARVKDSKVGGLLAGGLDVRGISGGEKRRLSIACGLVANPSIIFLDEPTTGLDSHAALAVMKYLHSLTHLGHTIVSTIHQPRQEIFKSFDKLLVMSEGYLMFLAPPEYVLPWFNEILEIPYNKAKHGTVADWLLGAVALNFQTAGEADASSKSMGKIDDIIAASERFKDYQAGTHVPGGTAKMIGPVTMMSEFESEDASDETQSKSAFSEAPSKPASLFASVNDLDEPVSETRHVPSALPASELPVGGNATPPPDPKTYSLDPSDLASAAQFHGIETPPEMRTLVGEGQSMYARGWATQFMVLFHRFILQQLRNPTEAGMRLLAGVWCGVFFGLVWIRLPNDANSAQERLALIFFTLMMFAMVPFAYMAFPAHDKRFFALDVARGLYSPSAYFLAYTTANAPFMVLNSWGTVIVVYGLAGLRYEAYAIIQFCMILSLHALISNQLLVFTIWYFDGQDSAFSVATIYSAWSLLICGFYIRVSEMTLSVMRALSWASYSKYTFQCLAYTELYNRKWDNAPCNEQAAAPGFEQSAPLCDFAPDFLLQYYDFRLPTYKSALGLLAFYFGFALLSYWALLRIYKKR